MLLTTAEMQSPILRAGLILLVRIDALTPGGWHAASGRFEQREVEVRFVVERVLQGDAGVTDGESVVATIVQFRARGPRYIALPGVWSSLEIDVGLGFVTFSSPVATVGDLAAALRDPGCFHVGPEHTALPDTEIALAAGMPPMPIGMLLARHAEHRGGFGTVLARTIVDRVVETLFDDLAGFDQVLATAIDPVTSPRVMLMIMRGVCDALLRHEPAPAVFISRFLVAVATVAARPDTEVFRSMMFRTYVPNLLGVVGGLARRPAATVFAAEPPVRDAVRAGLAGDPEQAAQLLEWIDA